MEFTVSKTAFRSENDWIRTTREVQIMPLEWCIHARQPSQSGAANWPVRMTCFLFISIIRLSAKRHRRGYETRVLSLVKNVCYTVYGRVRYTTQAVEVSGGVV